MPYVLRIVTMAHVMRKRFHKRSAAAHHCFWFKGREKERTCEKESRL